MEIVDGFGWRRLTVSLECLLVAEDGHGLLCSSDRRVDESPMNKVVMVLSGRNKDKDMIPF